MSFKGLFCLQSLQREVKEEAETKVVEKEIIFGSDF